MDDHTTPRARPTRRWPGAGAAGTLALLLALAAGAWPQCAAAPPTMDSVLGASHAGDWRRIDPEDTLYLELPGGRVVVELAPTFAPRHVANVKRLARAGYFDGLAVVRSQDNYVVQWGDPGAGGPGARTLPEGASSALPAELERPARDAPRLVALPDGDAYAPQVGFAGGFPVAGDPASGRLWLAHCYGMVGAGRDVAADSGSGAELYAVIGHAPRHLDRNVTLLGRVVHGMEHLSTLPRGHGPLGFYEDPARHVPVRSVRVGADLPAAERLRLEALRTDTDTFQALLETRRHRRESWFLEPTGRIGLCNVPLPVREAPAASPREPMGTSKPQPQPGK